jgi:ligand-binding sensor domain-containing protein/two-component sensor histidine kinase
LCEISLTVNKLLIAAFLSVGFFLLPFDRAARSQEPSFVSYTIENGAPSNEIYKVISDKHGYIWIGCDAGVYRFNGVKFEHFTSPELTARSATGLCEGRNGRIYGYNFNHQFFYIEHDRLQVVSNWMYSVNGIAHDGKGSVWLSGYEGVFRYDENSGEFIKIEHPMHIPSQHGTYVSDNVQITKNNVVYYHQSKHLMRWQNGSAQAYALPDEFTAKPCILSSNSTAPWIFDVINQTVLQPTEKGWLPYTNEKLRQLLMDRKITSVHEIENRYLFIHTYSGLIRLDKKTGKAQLYFPNLSFSSATVDFQGNYWLSTLHDGLIRISRFDILSWSKQSGAVEHEQYSHITGTKNYLYFASTSGELLEIDRHTERHIEHRHEPKSDFGMLYFDQAHNRILFNKLGQIYQYQSNSFSLLGGNRPVKALWYDQRAGYLIASSQGLFIAPYPEQDPMEQTMLLDGWYRAISPGFDEHTLFVASNKGLFEIGITNGNFQLKKNLLEGKQVLSLSLDKENQQLFALAFDGTIYSLKLGEPIREFHKLQSSSRAVQLVHQKGFLYLATNEGLLRINCSDKSISILNSNSGLSSNNIRQLYLTESHCWAATGKGVNMLPLDAFEQNLPKGKILLRTIRINGTEWNGKSQLELQYDEGLTILLDGLCYASKTDFQFAYLLEGQSEKWIKVPGVSGRIDIPRLPSGKFSLNIKLVDHLGRDSENVITLKLFVIPAFYERWWFYLLIGLATAGIVVQIFRIRIRTLRKKQVQQLQQLKLENELRLTQQNALKAQMNPHFLFNVLNSIKGYIYENDKKNAARYLSDFSSLVRKILDMSAQPTVSLQQELEALKNYIDLEAMLLQSDFDYEISVDDNVDSASIQIPALLIQPYVENSFKHGLRHKPGEKKLQIQAHYNELEHILTVRITDNGIGRHASAEINQHAHKEHDSFATGAMEKRIELLNHEKEGLVGVEIIDNFGEDGNPSGTTVNIRIHV